MAIQHRQEALKVLSISSTASDRDIKKAYKRLAIQYHPDRTGGDINKALIFITIKEAYTFLSKAKSQTTDPKPQEPLFPVRTLGKNQYISLKDIDIWKYASLDKARLSTAYCEAVLLTLLDIPETEAHKKRLKSYLNNFFARQKTFIILGAHYSFESDNTYPYVAFTAMFITEYFLNYKTYTADNNKNHKRISFMTSFFTEMRSPYKINMYGQRAKRNVFEKTYQKFMP